ncbi:transposase family protein [Nonomuraea sp. NPDC050202]|uniref:transposase family protein n=1 Tax=Nonomuraea sp. NPDC050202 TaxID=3155035 RepID=UPI0033CC3AB3
MACTGTELAVCPRCATPTTRVHDRYQRRLQDVSCGGRPIQVALEVRRFLCGSGSCPVATFAEQVDGRTAKHQRRTVGLRALLERVALALAGSAGSVWRARWARSFALHADPDDPSAAGS